jgi:hypothetical protein
MVSAPHSFAASFTSSNSARTFIDPSVPPVNIVLTIRPIIGIG